MSFDDQSDRYEPPSGMDKFFLDSHIALFIILALCCNPVALILGILGLVLCKHPDAKQRALILTIVSGVLFAIAFLVNLNR
jgi:hypothetical protein